MMKQSFAALAILGLSLSLHAEGSMDQANSGTYLKPPAAPQYETCGYTTVENGHGGTYQVQDQACQNRNAEKQRNYSAALEVYNRSSRMLSADASKSSKPATPVYEDCKTTETGSGGYYMDYACQQRNQAKQNDYNIQMSGWNKMQEEESKTNQAAQSEEQRRALAEAQSASATEALRKAQEQNQKSASSSNKAATITQALSIASGVAFAVSCAGAGATCNYAFLAASIGFGMMSSKNSRQASQNVASAASACATQAQLNASSNTDCNAVANTQTGATPLVPGVFNTNGECVASDKSICDKIIADLPAGTNIKDVVKGASTFAMTPPYKTNPDGSVTTKDGKTFKASDFNNKEALMAAGLSEEQAAAAMSSMGKAGLGSPSSGVEQAKADLKDAHGKKIDFGGGSISGSSSEGSGAAGAGMEASGALSSKSIGGSASGAGNGHNGLGKRNPAGEGLTRDFNGESIGAAGDDIFSMMNRRYKMKTAQDTFISNQSLKIHGQRRHCL